MLDAHQEFFFAIPNANVPPHEIPFGKLVCSGCFASPTRQKKFRGMLNKALRKPGFDSGDYPHLTTVSACSLSAGKANSSPWQASQPRGHLPNAI